MWIRYKMYFVTEMKLFTITNTESVKLLILLKLGCLGNVYQPQKLLNILGSEPWLLIKRLLRKRLVYVNPKYRRKIHMLGEKRRKKSTPQKLKRRISIPKQKIRNL